MFVAHVITGDLWAGAEVQLYNTVIKLIERNIHNYVVIIFSGGELYRRLKANNVRVELISEDDNNSFKIAAKLAKLIKLYNIDLTHVHEYKSHIITQLSIVSCGREIKMIRTLHGSKLMPRGIKYVKSYFLTMIENMLLRYYTDCIIAVSKDIENKLINQFPKSKIYHVNNAIIQPSPEEIGDIISYRSYYNIKKEDLWIGAASRLVDIKNIDMLIDGVHILSKKLKNNYKVTIFGDGKLKDHLNIKINDLQLNNIIKIYPHNNNIIPIINSFDIFVNTSLHEGLPMSILESMSVSTVPVCTNVGGMKEIINDKQTGFLVESKNADNLANTLLYILNNKSILNEIGVRAREYVNKYYSIEASVNKLEEIYYSQQLTMSGNNNVR